MGEGLESSGSHCVRDPDVDTISTVDSYYKGAKPNDSSNINRL